MFTRHQLTCQRAGCGRPFTATRSDALYCSRRCRRDKTPVTPPVRIPAPSPAPAVVEAVSNGEEPAEGVEEEDLHGWRRVGGYLIPPFDPRNVFRADDWFR